MRIGIDARLWNETGVGRYIRNLVTNLQDIDEKNSYVLFVRSRDHDRIRNYELRIKNNWRTVNADIHWHTLEEQFKFPQLLYKENLDLVHFPYFSVPIFVNIPFVVTIHDLILHHFSTGEASTLFPVLYAIKLSGYKYVIHQAIKKAKKVITVSFATKQEIVDHMSVSGDKVVVTYEGVDPEMFEKHTKKIIADPYFLHVGNMYPHKNMERLVIGFKKVFSNTSVKLVLVGKEDFFAKRLKDFVRKKEIDSNVIFVGEVSDKELSSYYQHALALVIPSLMEGFGLPAIEAMANNCLILASDIPVLKEICKDAAFYFDPHDETNMAEKMRFVAGKSRMAFEKQRESGLSRMLKFSWEKLAKETLTVYESSARLRPR